MQTHAGPVAVPSVSVGSYEPCSIDLKWFVLFMFSITSGSYNLLPHFPRDRSLMLLNIFNLLIIHSFIFINVMPTLTLYIFKSTCIFIVLCYFQILRQVSCQTNDLQILFLLCNLNYNFVMSVLESHFFSFCFIPI